MRSIILTSIFVSLLSACAPEAYEDLDEQQNPNNPIDDKQSQNPADDTTTETPVDDATAQAKRLTALSAIWQQDISAPIVQQYCVVCHTDSSIAKDSALVFLTNNQSDYQSVNLTHFLSVLDGTDDKGQAILNKASGVGHGGGLILKNTSQEFLALQQFIQQATDSTLTTPVDNKETDNSMPSVSVSRQAAIDFYTQNIENKIIQPDCYVCHQSNGVASRSDLIFVGNNVSGYAAFNAANVIQFAQSSTNNRNNVLLKPAGQNHSGGKVIDVISQQATDISNFLDLVDKIDDTPVTVITNVSNFQGSSLLNSVVLAWEINSQHDAIEIQRKTNNTDWQLIATLNTGVTLYQDATALVGEAYEYRARVVLATEYSEYSQPLMIQN